MGALLSFLSRIFGNTEVRALILGLDNAGKTTILYKLYAPGRTIRTMPTIGFNVENVEYKNLTFSVWDLGGQTNIRPYWRCYYANTNAIIYVVDSTDKERMGLTRKELFSMLEEEELKNVHLLVFANKQDMKGAMSEIEITKALGLHSIKDRQWAIFKSVAINGVGLIEGFEWLHNCLLGTSTTYTKPQIMETATAATSARKETSTASSSSEVNAKNKMNTNAEKKNEHKQITQNP